MQKRDEEMIREGPEELVALYKPFSMNQSKRREYGERFNFTDLDIESENPEWQYLSIVR